jgi:hypothetical protein
VFTATLQNSPRIQVIYKQYSYKCIVLQLII